MAAVAEATRSATVPDWVWRSRDWAPAIHLLYSDMLRDKLRPGDVDFEGTDPEGIGRPGIWWDRIRARSGVWSTGEQLFLDLAQELYNRGAQVRLADLLGSLDERYWRIAMEAVYFKRYGRRGAAVFGFGFPLEGTP